MTRYLCLLTALTILTASTLSAQTPSPGPYVDIGAMADTDGYTFERSPLTRPAVGASAGLPFASRWRVEFEFVLPAPHQDAGVQNVFDAMWLYGRPVSVEGTRDHRLVTYSVITGRDFSLGSRVQWTPLVGMTIADHFDRDRLTVSIPQPSGAITRIPPEGNSHEALFAVVWGADVLVTLTPRIAIVPEWRVHVFPEYGDSPPLMRTGVALRIGL